MLLKTVFVLALAAFHGATGAKILALMTTPSRSHHIWNRSLMRALAARGHEVTVLTPDPEKTAVPNQRELVIEGAYDYLHSDSEAFDYQALSDVWALTGLLTLYSWATQMCEQGISSEGSQTLMQMKNETFDLIIVEVVVSECFLGFVHHFDNPPVMAITAYSSPPWVSSILGNPDSPAYVPDLSLPFSDKMSFLQRLENTFMYLATKLLRAFHLLPQMDAIVRAHFGESTPSVSEIESRIGIVMVNTQDSVDYPRPLLPAVIPVGGMHITPPEPLPQDLKKFMDEAPHGVIFFSLGSNVRSDKLRASTIKHLLEAFKELPQRVLWKWESDALPGQPANVKLGKWLPQNDILAHPNVRLFISHCGLLSLQEAVHRGVPVVGMPFMADQHTNINKAMHHGVGEKLDYVSLTKESVLEVVNKVIGNASYRDNMKRLSELFRDQPQSAMDRAIFWTEYVIRHKGATHLRSTALDLAWYQYLLLDVIAAFALGALFVLLVLYVLVCAVVRAIVRPNKVKVQ